MSIRERKHTHGYCWQVQWRDHDGKQHSREFATQSRAEAQRGLHRVRRLIPTSQNLL